MAQNPTGINALIGTDTKLPIAGKFEQVSGLDLLIQDLEQLILTVPGERVNRPTFGCMLNARIWENLDSTAQRGKTDIQAAIEAFEPRVTLLDVSSSISREDGLVFFSIRFLINSTNESANLVLPFRATSDLLSLKG